MPLTITVPATELYDRERGQFVSIKETTLTLEHSLVSLAKWESKWEVPYLSKKPKTDEQVLDYIRFMTLTKNVDPNVYMAMTNDNFMAIKQYIEKPHTATTINEHDSRSNSTVMTAEVIYWSMIAQNIPKEFEKWHLNRLITLIRVCAIKNAPPKKRGFMKTQNQYKAINDARRKLYNSKG